MATSINEAPRKLSDSYESAQERADASKCLQGNGRIQDTAGCAPARKISAIKRRGLSDSAAAEFAKRPRIRFYKVRRCAPGEATEQSAECRAIVAARGLAYGAAGQRRADSLAQTQFSLIPAPADLKGANGEFLRGALRDARQPKMFAN